MTTDNFVPMTPNDLAKAWPDYAGTHDISDTELALIASVSRDVVVACGIWKNEDWWRDGAEFTARPLESEFDWLIAHGIWS